MLTILSVLTTLLQLWLALNSYYSHLKTMISCQGNDSVVHFKQSHTHSRRSQVCSLVRDYLVLNIRDHKVLPLCLPLLLIFHVLYILWISQIYFTECAPLLGAGIQAPGCHDTLQPTTSQVTPHHGTACSERGGAKEPRSKTAVEVRPSLTATLATTITAPLQGWTGGVREMCSEDHVTSYLHHS